jgi:hypothetical protein
MSVMQKLLVYKWRLPNKNKIDKNTTGRLKSGFFNTAIAFGGLTKIVRAGSELLGTTYFLPVRAGLMGAMAMTRLSEAGKEAHFSEKERQQREVEEQSIARDAQEISQELIGIAEVGPEKGNVNTSNDVINGIKNRLKKYGKSKSNQG